MPDIITSQEKTVQFNREELNEGWAELGRMPRVLATVKLGAKTDLGRIRENNEDKFDFFEPEDPAVLATKGSFYGLADGMGGHSAGQIACELALKIVIRQYYANPSADTHASLRRAIDEANSLIYDTAQMMSERNGMGTTLTCCLIREDMMTISQVGDSRAYLIRDGEIQQITEDHEIPIVVRLELKRVVGADQRRPGAFGVGDGLVVGYRIDRALVQQGIAAGQ